MTILAVSIAAVVLGSAVLYAYRRDIARAVVETAYPAPTTPPVQTEVKL